MRQPVDVNLHGEEHLGKVIDIRLLARLWTYARPYTGAIILAVLLLVATSVLTLLPPELVKDAIDNHIQVAVNTDAGTIEKHLAEVNRTVLYLLIILVVSAIVVFLQQVVMAYAGQRVMCDLRSDVFAKLQRLPLSYYDRNPTGRLVTRVTNDIEVMNEAFVSVVIYVCRDVFIMLGILVRLGTLNSRLTPWMLVSVPVIAVAAALFRPVSRRYWRTVREALARLNSFLHESLSGVHIIKMFNREQRHCEKLANINQANCKARIDIIRVDSMFNSIIMTITAVPISLLLYLGGQHILEGTLTPGEFFVYLVYLGLFYGPITGVAEKFLLLQSAMAAGERVFQVMDQKNDLPDPAGPKPDATATCSIVFDDVSFSYDGSTDVLHSLSFKVEPGETVALVGNTGSGKTTTTSLIPRFYDVGSGRVLVDGIDVREFTKQDLRKRIAIVMQDTFVFSASIRDNVRLFSESITDADVQTALEMVGADDFVRALPNGLNEVLPERGTSLSAGQRQLIAFARALAHDREILILDEATASVDTKTEMLIQKATETLLKGRTSIVVAHRLSTIKHADRILVFKNGRIIEDGNHEQLIAKGGTYYKMYRLQFADQERA